ncbi:MAG TPA: MFS transporter [Patescibacteria group bacterium]|nr:MFS transporter [Patescibacteria group bacterium]
MGFFFHEMGYGLLSIFLPLYVIAIGGSLFEIGVMISVALLLSIPTSFLWGYLCDRGKRYKRYILLSFLASTVLLYLFTFTSSVLLLILLYSVMSIFHVAHEAPKNVLIAELYSRQDWEKSFAFYEGFTEVGWLIGLLLGFVLSTLMFNSAATLFFCAGLNLVAFLLSLVLVRDPAMVFERGLVSIEKSVDFASRGIFIASSMIDGVSVTTTKLKRDNVNAFCGGLILFSLATSILFTPMPIFVSNTVKTAALPAGLVFVVFVLNSGGGVLGYALAQRRSEQSTTKSSTSRLVFLRGIFAFLLILVIQLSALASVGLATAVLIVFGFLNALFLVNTLSLSMEVIPAGKSGLFNVLIGVGGAGGSFLGPLIAQSFGFLTVFIMAGVVFLLAYVAFKIF